MNGINASTSEVAELAYFDTQLVGFCITRKIVHHEFNLCK